MKTQNPPLPREIFRVGVIIIALIILSSRNTFAQGNEFIVPKLIVPISLSNKAIDFERKMMAKGLVKKIDYAVIGNLRLVQKNGNLDFSVPGYSKRVKAKATYVEFISDNQYKWYGKTDNGRGDVNLFPNPADHSIVVNYSFYQEGEVKAELINNQGEVILFQHMGYQLAGMHSFTMDIGNLEPGLYYVKVQNPKSIITKRVLIKTSTP